MADVEEKMENLEVSDKKQKAGKKSKGKEEHSDAPLEVG